jgi:hypothetical protein
MADLALALMIAFMGLLTHVVLSRLIRIAAHHAYRLLILYVLIATYMIGAAYVASALLRILPFAEVPHWGTLAAVILGGLLFALHHRRTEPPARDVEAVEVLAMGGLLLVFVLGFTDTGR